MQTSTRLTNESTKVGQPACRFPPPWSVDELDACFVVRDHSGQALAYVYFENEPGPTLGDEAAYCRCGVDVRDDGTIGARDDGAGLRAGVGRASVEAL